MLTEVKKKQISKNNKRIHCLDHRYASTTSRLYLAITYCKTSKEYMMETIYASNIWKAQRFTIWSFTEKVCLNPGLDQLHRHYVAMLLKALINNN